MRPNKETQTVNRSAKEVGAAVNFTFQRVHKGKMRRRIGRLQLVSAERMSQKETNNLARDHKIERKRLARVAAGLEPEITS